MRAKSSPPASRRHRLPEQLTLVFLPLLQLPSNMVAHNCDDVSPYASTSELVAIPQRAHASHVAQQRLPPSILDDIEPPAYDVEAQPSFSETPQDGPQQHEISVQPGTPRRLGQKVFLCVSFLILLLGGIALMLAPKVVERSPACGTITDSSWLEPVLLTSLFVWTFLVVAWGVFYIRILIPLQECRYEVVKVVGVFCVSLLGTGLMVMAVWLDEMKCQV